MSASGGTSACDLARRPGVALAPTPRDLVWRDGTAALYRFRTPSPASAGDGAPEGDPIAGHEAGAPVDRREAEASPVAGLPLLLVPSLINRWFVLDLREGASLAAVLARSLRDVYCLDWGVPEDEDRYLTWDDVLARLARAVRVVRRRTGARRVGLLGYCIGGTLSAIHAARHPEEVAALVNLAGPIDFSHAGQLGTMVDARWFDAQAIADAGNVGALQMQSGFLALRPTGSIAKWVALADRAHDPAARESFAALEAWASDNIPFPGAAYATYIRELYQDNQLVRGEHRVGGEVVDLARIDAPVLTITADRDAICPPEAALALAARVATPSAEREVLTVPGGHVGAVVGARAAHVLYPRIADFTRRKLCSSIN